MTRGTITYPPPPLTGNLVLVMNEIGHALDRYTATREATIIDLGNLPMAPQEKDGLHQALGRGEVSARVTAQGDSEVYETSYPGVWRVTHLNDDGAPMAQFIEITDLPAILAADLRDMAGGRRRLARQLDILRGTEEGR